MQVKKRYQPQFRKKSACKNTKGKENITTQKTLNKSQNE